MDDDGTTARQGTALPWLLLAASVVVVAWIVLDRGADGSPSIDPTGAPATPAEMDYEPREAPAVPIPTPPEEPAERASPFEPTKRAPTPSPLLAKILADPKPYAGAVEAARVYFDLDEEQWKGRAELVRALERLAEQGDRLLAVPDALRWLVMQGRGFEPPLTDRTWQRASGIPHAKSLGGTLYQLQSEALDVTISFPKDAATHRTLERAYPRPAPRPWLVSLHDPEDAAAAASDTGSGSTPGQVLMQRRYGDRNLWASLYRDWYVLLPHARTGGFMNAEGQPRAEVLQQPLSVFWKHHHVDFDRVVLDGGRDAFAAAGSMPIFFAGIVLRGGWTLDARMQAEVRNFARVPVYVVDDAALAKALTAAGHPDVTQGPANEGLVQWMTDRRRTTPKRFAWTAARTDQVLPYWVNLDSPDWRAPGRCLEVEVVDTEEEPNTIRMRATGINVLTLFLNDDIVDLDRPVRVTMNGHLEHDARLEIQDKRLEPLGRDFDFLFNREPLRIRNSMYFGWLTPARIAQIAVRRPGADDAPAAASDPDEPPALSAADRVKAERLRQKAEDLRKNGLHEDAERVMKRIEELPRHRARQKPRAPYVETDPLPCPSLPPIGAPAQAAAAHTPAEPPPVLGPVERTEPPAGPPPHDPGAVDVEPTPVAPSWFDGRWLLAALLAVVGLRLLLRRG